MRTLTCAAFTCTLFAASLALGQAPEIDKVSQQTSQLEAELGKLKESSPEAAEILLKLVDTYHQQGRVFGLIRAGQTFTSFHPAHQRHAEVMLKLLDGLQAASRNEDVVAVSRQFLARYGDHASAAAVERTLADTLEQLNDRQATAAAHEAVWRRSPATHEGRVAAHRAITLYASVNNGQAYTKAAELGEAVVDAYPGDAFVANCGWQAVVNWQRVNQWAKSNQAGNKLLKKGLPKDETLLLQLHRNMADNYNRLGQRANGLESLRQARKLRDSQELHSRFIVDLYHSGGKGPELEKEVNTYFQKYPQRKDRFSLRSYAAIAYLRDGDKDKSLALIRELLPYSATANNLASVYVQQNGAEPEKLADSEKTLKAALAKNESDAAYIRYVLAFELYRDRLKDPAKAKATLRDLLAKSPSNDNYTQSAISWLLYNAENDAEFAADLQRAIKVREEHFHWSNLRGYLNSWVQQAKRNKEHKARATKAQETLAAADAKPWPQAWLAVFQGRKGAIEARNNLLTPPQLNKLTDEQARLLFIDQASAVYANGNTRNQTPGVYGRMAKRFPKDYQVALWYLNSASSYAPPEVAKEAAQHLLTFEPQEHSENYDAWYRLMLTADRNKDADLARQAYGWITKCQKSFGLDPRYADSIGDVLQKYEMKDEALAYWRQQIPVDYDSYYSRTCAERVLRTLEGPQRKKFLDDLIAKHSDYHGAYAMWLANDYLLAKDLENFRKTMQESHQAQQKRFWRNWGVEEYVLGQWVGNYRSDAEATEDQKRLVYTTVRDLNFGRPTASAMLALLELPPPEGQTPMQRLLAYQRATTVVDNASNDWDWLIGYAQAAMTRKDYAAVATLASGMLANIPGADANRQKLGRDMVAQSYARMGSVGLSIDDSSPIAPLLQAALYLRLGDKRLAYDTYLANKGLFDKHRDEVPTDLVLFICQSHMAAGGDENHDRVEDILRGWLVKFSEAKDLDDDLKAKVQLLLARNYFKAQRYDVARSEYLTVKNRYAGTPQAIEAEFGIGECYMAQKVYDQAEAVFESLAASRERDVVIRAEFLRGVLANRRGDRDDARDIFRRVLNMVPTVELANEALFNLSEVYGAEERYIDQLELLRTVGRLGRHSKRWHNPGTTLSIVVYDPDLGVSRGHSRIPVRVTTSPGGDEELVYLLTTPGGKGLFRADLETRLGAVEKEDRILQLTGRDTIQCDYPDEFKAEFRSAPLSDAEIRVAANGKLEVASSKIVDEKRETFTERIEREAREAEEMDERRSQNRPKNQIKPGNLVYMRVLDSDRDLSDDADEIIVKLSATSGDQVRVALQETEPHSGVFEGTAPTAELPAGALASDTAIDHNPLMAIDQDPATYWLSEPDGATPKWLSVDMKDLRYVDRVTISTPDAARQAPVRGQLQGSHDGRFWFRLSEIPPQPPVEPIAEKFGPMTMRVYGGVHYNIGSWQQVVQLAKNGEPILEEQPEQLSWSLTAEDEDAKKPRAVIWSGKLVQPRSGAIRFAVQGYTTAVMVDKHLELPIGRGGRSVDVWLDRGTHDLTIFSAVVQATQGMSATRAREDHNVPQVTLSPFRRSDFDLDQPGAKPALPREAPRVTADNGVWDFRFDTHELRHVRLRIDEYLGEAVAINHVEITGEEGAERHIPTKTDILALAHNQILEIAAGDEIDAIYTDEFTQNIGGRSQLLTAKLVATYFNAQISPIAYDFVRQPNGAVQEVRKQLIRIDPGEKFIVEITDYDLDTSGEPDKLRFQVSVNDGEPIELVANETDQYSGVFTKEVLTSAEPAEGKLVVKPGDRLYCTYLDSQNTFPGHSVPRETVVYVNEPSEARIRVVETRLAPVPEGSKAPPRPLFLTQNKPADVAKVAFEAPFTVEVYDRDAAKDSRSSVTVQLVTTDGAKIEVECVVSPAYSDVPANQGGLTWALEEGRFLGQVILQLGGKNSQDLAPLTADMPRNLIGGPTFSEDEAKLTGGNLVARVLNLSGKDIVTATYKDALRPDGKPLDLPARGRLIANGALACTDRDYDKPVEQLHVGEKLFLRVIDADLDTSDERDLARVVVTTERGEKETLQLEETLAHSGVFTGSVTLKPAESPTAGNLSAETPEIETFFGDDVRLEYLDKAASTESGELTLSVEVPVVIGTDGLVTAFSKTFNDETLAVETQFHIAESYFELFKSHKKLGRKDEQQVDLESGRRVLREVMEDYPDPKYAPRISYLLGQFAQELSQWDEAIEAYRLIVRQYPDHSLAPDAQYKLAQCYEESNEFDQALEAYVTLAATYPKNPLIANVMIRISDHFYREKNYEVAAQVGAKFIERFEGHEWASRMAFRVGQCYYKGEKFKDAALAFDDFAKAFPDDGLCSDAIFWSGESFRLGKNNPEAFRRYNMCRWKFPASEAAKYARGRLALPEMLQQFEREAADLEDE